jgi:hypothetical protein
LPLLHEPLLHEPLLLAPGNEHAAWRCVQGGILVCAGAAHWHALRHTGAPCVLAMRLAP